jgi:hypothetical protein
MSQGIFIRGWTALDREPVFKVDLMLYERLIVSIAPL